METQPGTLGTTEKTAKPRWATVRIDTGAATYVGRLYIPDPSRRLSDVLCDERPFLAMTEVTISGTETIEPFVALNKSVVRTVHVLKEVEADLVPSFAS